MRKLLLIVLKRGRNERAFTLIELMVVVIILGILAAIAIPQFSGQSEKAKEKAAKADLKTLGTAAEMFVVENNNTEPGDLSDLEPDYIKKVPSDPWGGNYVFDQGADSDDGDFSIYYTHDSVTVSYPDNM